MKFLNFLKKSGFVLLLVWNTLVSLCLLGLINNIYLEIDGINTYCHHIQKTIIDTNEKQTKDFKNLIQNRRIGSSQ